MADLARHGVVLVTVGLLTNIPEYPRVYYFNVNGPPLISDCSFAPEDPTQPLIALESNFTLQCSPSPSEVKTPVRYSVYCNASSDGADFPDDLELFSDFYPTASDIVMPVDSCDAYLQLENTFNFISTRSLGKFALQSQVEIIPPENTTEPERVLVNILHDVKAIASMNDSDANVTSQKKAVILSRASARVNRVLLNDSTAATQDEASLVLRNMSEQLLNITYEPRDPAFETYFRNSSKHILESVGTVMQLQTQQPNVTDDDKANISRVADSLQDTVWMVMSALLNRTEVRNITVNVTTPVIDMKVWKAERNDTVGKTIKLHNITLEMPEGVGDEGVISMSAVATTLNPEPLAAVEHATNYLNVTFDGPGVEKQDFPISYSFPRKAPVQEDEDSPNVIRFNLTGKAHCVRYNSERRLYGWRVLSDAAAMSIEIPAGGRAFITVASNASRYLEELVHRVDLLVNNETVGKICWPVTEEASYSSIKLTRHLTDENEDELWVESGRSGKTRVGLGFGISYTDLARVSPPLRCDASLARRGGQTYSVATPVRLLQMLGQCLKYDERLRRFVHNEKCKVFPGKDTIRCECTGASLHTAVDPPLTNKIDFTSLHTIDIKRNPLPFIFSVSVCGLFLLLCLIGVLQDIRGKKKLAPLTDAAAVSRPIKYNVFLYMSKFRCSRARRNLKFSFTMQGSGGTSATNTFTTPSARPAAMLHLLVQAEQQLGAIRTVKVTPQDKGFRWHVSRVVLSDPVEKEVVVFEVNGWVKSDSEPYKRLPEASRNRWRENFFVRVVSDVMEAIPVMMLMLPSRVQERKLDHMLAYALSLMLWAMIHLLFYVAVDPLYRPDDCVEENLSTTQAALNSGARLLINMALTAGSSILIGMTIGKSRMYKEVKSEESRSWGLGGLLPLPHWVRLAVRGVASVAVVVTVAFLTIMSYMFRPTEFNAWLLGMAEAFGFQILSKALGKLVTCAARYILYPPRDDKFTEGMVNPEGMLVQCPECRVCPDELHIHFAEHLSSARRGPLPSYLRGSSSSSLLNQHRLFPV